MVKLPSEFKFPELIKAPVKLKTKSLLARISPLLLEIPEVKLILASDNTSLELVKDVEEIIAKSSAE